ncbi:hypothetical protein [Hydrogenophaga sp. ANAO-22]|uniref:hypothetical protein n=1 Tax=Hydrogenophaga sp. ANAO-22 TaxID=3166645 RepID=UPI0036D2390B
MSLTGGDSADHALENDTLDSALNHVIAQLRQAYLKDENQLELAFESYAKSLEEAANLGPGSRYEPPVWFDLCVHRKPTPAQFPLHLTGNNFTTDDPAAARAGSRGRWSDGLRPQDRSRLAQALLIVREELHRLRILGLDPSNARIREDGI